MAKKSKPQTNYNLFEAPSPPSEETHSSPSTEKSTSRCESDACPRCGACSQPTAHPIEHDGKTRYCIVCVGTDGEPYYFMPEAAPGSEKPQR
jgi:hypothetical protein